MGEPKITLYWLNHSRSQRILWLLEELNLKYELEIFKRGETSFRAPQELKKIHPLGKSPVLKIDDKVLGESGLIAQYLVSHFDTDCKLTPTTESDKIDVDYYIHYAEGTLQPIIVAYFGIAFARKKLTLETQLIGGKAIDPIWNDFYLPELYLNFDFLEGQLEGKTYFVGDKLTAADILLSFPIGACFNGPIKIDREYPNLQKWVNTINSNKTKQRCDELVKGYNGNAKF